MRACVRVARLGEAVGVVDETHAQVVRRVVVIHAGAAGPAIDALAVLPFEGGGVGDLVALLVDHGLYKLLIFILYL